MSCKPELSRLAFNTNGNRALFVSRSSYNERVQDCSPAKNGANVHSSVVGSHVLLRKSGTTLALNKTSIDSKNARWFMRRNMGKHPEAHKGDDGVRSASARAAMRTDMSASKKTMNANGGRRAEVFAQTPLSEEPEKNCDENANGRRRLRVFAQTLSSEEPKESRGTARTAQIRLQRNSPRN